MQSLTKEEDAIATILREDKENKIADRNYCLEASVKDVLGIDEGSKKWGKESHRSHMGSKSKNNNEEGL